MEKKIQFEMKVPIMDTSCSSERMITDFKLSFDS